MIYNWSREKFAKKINRMENVMRSWREGRNGRECGGVGEGGAKQGQNITHTPCVCEAIEGKTAKWNEEMA